MLEVTHEYAGYSDYWGGNGRRWKDNAGCLFAFYGPDTALKDCVEQWCQDFYNGGDCDKFPEHVTHCQVKAAILKSLTEQGLKDYHSGALCEFAADLEDDSDSDLWAESPVWILLIEYYK